MGQRASSSSRMLGDGTVSAAASGGKSPGRASKSANRRGRRHRRRSSMKDRLAALSYSGAGAYLGRTDKEGRRHGLGVEYFDSAPLGSSRTACAAFAGDWKKGLWNGHGVCFLPPTHHDENSSPASTVVSSSSSSNEWFVGHFKKGQVDGEAVQFDIHEHDVAFQEGIWRKGELVYAKRVGRSLIAKARQRAGQALELARRVQEAMSAEAREIAEAGVSVNSVIDVRRPGASDISRALVTDVNNVAGTVTLQLHSSSRGGGREGGGVADLEETLSTVTFSEIMTEWFLCAPVTLSTPPVVRKVLPPSASLSRAFGMEKMSALQSSQLAMLQQVNERRRTYGESTLAAAAATAGGGRGESKTSGAGSNIILHGAVVDSNSLQFEPARDNRSWEFLNQVPASKRREHNAIVIGTVVGRSPRRQQTTPASSSSSSAATTAVSGQKVNDLDCLSEYEIRQMTLNAGWSDRELAALGRIRQRAQQRRMEREQQRRARHRRERDRDSRARGNGSQSSSSDGEVGAYIPREEDFLDHGADEMDSFAGSSIDDIFTYTGGMQSGPSRNGDQLTVQQVRARRSVQQSRHDPAWSDTSTEDSDSDDDESAGDVPTCSICLDRVKRVSSQRVLTCAHVFHASCIAEWLQRSNRCPLCRTEQ